MILLKIIAVIFLLAKACETDGRPHSVFRHEKQFKKKLEQCEERVQKLGSQRTPLETNFSSLILDDMMFAVDPEEAQSGPKYTLLISEVNLDNPGPNSKVYIELETISRQLQGSPPGNDLEGFLLLIIRGQPLEVVMSVPIGALLKKVEKGFLVLGTKEMGTVDIELTSPDVESIFEGQQALPDGDDSPYGIALLYSSLPSVLDDVSLEKNGNTYYAKYLAEDEHLKNIVRDNLVDFIVVGRKAPTNQCTFFESLKPVTFVNPDYRVLLRDWDGSTAQFAGDLSLSRCCSDKRPMDQECFRLSTPSAGQPNTCDFLRPFYLERVIPKLFANQAPADDDDNNMVSGECRPDYPNVPASRYALVNDHTYAAALNDELTQYSQCPSPVASANPDSVTSPPSAEAMEMEVDDGRPAMVPLFNFDTMRFEYCKRFLPHTKIKDIEVPSVTSWLEMIHDGTTCKFRCYMCALYLAHGFRADEKHPTQIMTSGYYSTNKSRNKAQIMDHIDPRNVVSYNIHQEAVSYVTSLQRARTADDVRNAEKEAHKTQRQVYRATMNAMKLSWAELRAELPFRSHPIFFETVKELGVNLGTYHSNDHALKFYARAYSQAFHRRLLKQLVDHHQPYSFMADATTNRNVGYLVCLIQTLENGRPVLYFWRMIRLTKSESGADMIADIKSWVDRDEQLYPGFKSYFTDNMVAFVSDRGSPMVGKKKGLIARFTSYTGRKIQSVSCSAHKTETAIKHALSIVTLASGANDKQKKYFMKFGDLNNKIYTHYLSRGSKRWAHLLDVAEEVGLKTSRIKYHHSIRWSQSKRMAMQALLKDYDLIREDLDRTSTGKGDSHRKAQEVLDIVRDKSFSVTLPEFVDMLTVSERMLDSFQQKHGILMDIIDTLRQGLRRFDYLKSNLGKNLLEFLTKISCPGVCEEGECSLEQYDSCQLVYYRSLVPDVIENDETDDDSSLESEVDEVDVEVVPPLWKLVPLEKKDMQSVPLSAWRTKLYERIVAEVKQLFDVKQLESFDLFDPHYLLFSCPNADSANKCNNLDTCYKTFVPIHEEDTPEVSTLKWDKICKFYNIQSSPCGARLAEWKRFLGTLTTQEKYDGLRNERSSSGFWSYALSDTALPWTAELVNLLRKILVTGQSSASAERAFSILSRLKSSDRSSLADDTVDDLIRIRFNGPHKIDDDSLYDYTLEFLKSHKRVDAPGSPEDGEKHISASEEEHMPPKGLYRSRIFSSRI